MWSSVLRYQEFSYDVWIQKFFPMGFQGIFEFVGVGVEGPKHIFLENFTKFLKGGWVGSLRPRSA